MDGEDSKLVESDVFVLYIFYRP